MARRTVTNGCPRTSPPPRLRYFATISKDGPDEPSVTCLAGVASAAVAPVAVAEKSVPFARAREAASLAISAFSSPRASFETLIGRPTSISAERIVVCSLRGSCAFARLRNRS